MLGPSPAILPGHSRELGQRGAAGLLCLFFLFIKINSSEQCFLSPSRSAYECVHMCGRQDPILFLGGSREERQREAVRAVHGHCSILPQPSCGSEAAGRAVM